MNIIIIIIFIITSNELTMGGFIFGVSQIKLKGGEGRRGVRR
jgi:hypothetical protein